MTLPETPSSNRRGRPRRDLDFDEAQDSTYRNDKRAHSSGTKKRLAESNVRHYDLQKQRGKELKEMIPEAFLEEAKDIEGSNRDLMHTLNATKLYIANLLEEKVQLQEQLKRSQNQSEDVDIGCDSDEDTRGGRGLRSHKSERSATNMRIDHQATVKTTTATGSRRIDHEPDLAIGPCPEARDNDGILSVTPAPDISPHDSLLRQAVEKFIALTKESVMASRGVFNKKQIDRMSNVHDCIVEMVEDMRKG